MNESKLGESKHRGVFGGSLAFRGLLSGTLSRPKQTKAACTCVRGSRGASERARDSKRVAAKCQRELAKANRLNEKQLLGQRGRSENERQRRVKAGQAKHTDPAVS